MKIQPFHETFESIFYLGGASDKKGFETNVVSYKLLRIVDIHNGSKVVKKTLISSNETRKPYEYT